MTRDPLVASELELVLSVLRQHQEIESATLFGSRAKGTHSDRSDVDLALAGPLGALGAEAIAAELEELPLPYRFDVHALAAITHAPLLEQIERYGVEKLELFGSAARGEFDPAHSDLGLHRADERATRTRLCTSLLRLRRCPGGSLWTAREPADGADD